MRTPTAVRQWREYADDYVGDFYPLTMQPGADVWLAWQYDGRRRPRRRSGVSPRRERLRDARLKLRGLDPRALLLANLDQPGDQQRVTGRELMDSGVKLASRPAWLGGPDLRKAARR